MGPQTGSKTIKYVVFILLGLAVVEATYQSVIENGLVRIAVAIVFLAYGAGTLLLFLRPSTEAKGRDRSKARVIGATAFQILLRVTFIFCALAYLAHAVGLYDPSVTALGSSRGYASYLLAILRYTIPPVADVFELVLPTVSAVAWNPANRLVLMLRWLSYLIYALVIVGTVREVFALARRDLRDLDAREKFANTRGAD